MIPKASGETKTAALEARVVDGESHASLQSDAAKGAVDGKRFMTQEADAFGLEQVGPQNYRCEVVIVNDQGFHMRPVTEFATLAQKFQDTTISIYKGNQKVDGKDPFDLLMLEAVACRAVLPPYFS